MRSYYVRTYNCRHYHRLRAELEADIAEYTEPAPKAKPMSNKDLLDLGVYDTNR